MRSAPPTGRSTFDFLMAELKPDSFPSLLKQLPAFKYTFIPAGRSLQRRSGAPDFFKYPRVVIAVSGDKLFMGYNEKSDSAEVISYNEEAGRFEFQVVRHFSDVNRRDVLYANRATCVACHQNESPMFSVAPWDETAANLEIFNRLRAIHGASYLGLPIVHSQDDPFEIDAATDRANLFLAYRRALNEYCPGSGQCRALVMEQMRRVHAGQTSVDLGHVTLKKLAPFKIPNPNLPNRELDFSASDLSEVPADLEPLNPRAPIEILPGNKETAVLLFTGLASYFTFEGQAAPGRLSSIKVDEVSPVFQSIKAARHMTVFKRCMACHRNEIGVPPNFLSGSEDEVKAKIAHCSERILYRLSMWPVEESQRRKSPMPPRQVLDLPEEDWLESRELKALVEYAKAAAKIDVTKKTYSALRECLGN